MNLGGPCHKFVTFWPVAAASSTSDALGSFVSTGRRLFSKFAGNLILLTNGGDDVDGTSLGLSA